MDFFFFQAEDGIRDVAVTGVQTCALPISRGEPRTPRAPEDRAAPRASTGVLISGLSGQPRSRVEAARGHVAVRFAVGLPQRARASLAAAQEGASHRAVVA